MQLKELCPKPSQAVQAMIDGIDASFDRDDFILDMGSYGHAEGDMCYGCAATCALQQVMGVRFTAETIGDRYTNEMHFEISDFESAIDDLRLADLFGLEHFYNVDLRAFDLPTKAMLMAYSVTGQGLKSRLVTQEEWQAKRQYYVDLVSNLQAASL